MRRSELGHRLLWHGLFLFLLGLLTGFAVPAVTNPRMGLAAHLEAVMNGLFLAVLAFAWDRFTLSARAAAALFWLAVYAAYVNWASNLLSAILGTSGLTPIAGAGFTGAAWQETLVAFGLISLSVAIVAVCILALWGLRTKVNTP